jgi:hypothetical protein
LELRKFGAPFDFEENFFASGTHNLVDKKPRSEFKKTPRTNDENKRKKK